MRNKYFLKGIWERPNYEKAGFGSPPVNSVVKHDVNHLLWSLRLQTLRRYFRQRFWEKETMDAVYAERAEAIPRLESIADHSWHVADMVLSIGGHFRTIDLGKCVQMAVLHDKLELIMGDKTPLGRDGKGLKTHAFNVQKQANKEKEERESLEEYKTKLSSESEKIHSRLFDELLEKKSSEARFLLGIDKLQPLAYIMTKKRGHLENDHILFTLRYSQKAVVYFPPLFPYYKELTWRLLGKVSRARKISRPKLMEELEDGQIPLFS
jgi:5'-deoxynucleotidase YfbR-like HD superfamily hydrolase